MLACARIGAIHSVVFGGFAANELADAHRRRAAEGDRLGVLRHRAGPGRSRTSRCSTRRSRWPRTSPSAASSCSARRSGRRWSQGATSTGTALMRRRDAGRLRAGGGHRPALHPLHLGHHRHAQGRRARQRRPRGGAEVDHEEHLRRASRARSSGPPRTSAGSSATPTSSTGRCCTGARRSSTRASRSARPTPGAFWRVIAAARRRTRCSPRRPRSARSSAKTPTGELHRASTTCRGFRTLFLAGERCDPDTLHWAQQQLGVPVIDHWWQTETGWPIAANCAGLGLLPVKPGSPHASRCPATTCACSTTTAASVPRGQDRATSSSSCRCRPAACRRCGSNDERLPRRPTSARYPGYYLTADAGYIDEDGYLYDHEPHRRHHQRRRPPPLHRRDGGGAGRAPRRRRVRRRRRGRRAQGRGAARAWSC